MPIPTPQTTFELDRARDHYHNRVIPPEKVKIMDRATEELVQSGRRSASLKEGDHVDDFMLIDAHDTPVRLQKLLKTGPAVIAFYRGGWRPYRNIELRGLRRALPEIKAGTPRKPRRSILIGDRTP
jgi:hypothetical protein